MQWRRCTRDFSNGMCWRLSVFFIKAFCLPRQRQVLTLDIQDGVSRSTKQSFPLQYNWWFSFFKKMNSIFMNLISKYKEKINFMHHYLKRCAWCEIQNVWICGSLIMSSVQFSLRLKNIIPRPRLKSSGCFRSIFYGREKDI